MRRQQGGEGGRIRELEKEGVEKGLEVEGRIIVASQLVKGSRSTSIRIIKGAGKTKGWGGLDTGVNNSHTRLSTPR